MRTDRYSLLCVAAWLLVAVLLGMCASPVIGAPDENRLIDGVLCNEHGYPVDAVYGILAAPGGTAGRPGGLGYGIPEKGWGPYVKNHVVKAIDSSDRLPDFVVNGVSGPVVNGQMCFASPLSSIDPPDWWAEHNTGPMPRVALTWGEWRRQIPPSIPFIQYCGRLNSRVLMEATDDHAVAIAEQAWSFFRDVAQADAIAIDATSVMGGWWDDGGRLTHWTWLQDDRRPLVQWATKRMRRPSDFGFTRVYCEAWPQSGQDARDTSNRLLRGVPSMMLSGSLWQSAMWEPRNDRARAYDHELHSMGRRYKKGAEYRYAPENVAQVRSDVSKGVSEIAIDVAEWSRIADLLPPAKWTIATIPRSDVR